MSGVSAWPAADGAADVDDAAPPSSESVARSVVDAFARAAQPPLPLSSRQRGVRKVAERCRLLRQIACFAKLTPVGLRKLVTALEQVAFAAGSEVCAAGAPAVHMWIVAEGRLAREGGGGAELGPGQSMGEMEILMGRPWSSSVRAAEDSVCLKLKLVEAKPVIERTFGTKAEVLKRKEMLEDVPLFADVEEAELLGLTTAMSRVRYTIGTDIVTEGQYASCMFIVVAGSPVVHTEKLGRLTNLEPGTFFGELGILAEESWRTATVRAMDGDVECFVLLRRDVRHLLSSEQCAEALAKARASYQDRADCRSSGEVQAVVEKIWRAVAAESLALAEPQEGQPQPKGVTQPGYERMHLCISKVLSPDFSAGDAVTSAEEDWAEDIVAFEHGQKVDVYLEMLKKKLRQLTDEAIHAEGWRGLFESFDEDHSGRLELDEFVQAVRVDMDVTAAVVSDDKLGRMFSHADTDDSGSLSGEDFSSWLSAVSAPHGAEAELGLGAAGVATDEDRDQFIGAVRALRHAAREEIAKYGWESAFAPFDTDGSGELNFTEFQRMLMGLGMPPSLLSTQDLRSMFRQVDRSRAGQIGAADFHAFISSDPLSAEMGYTSFAEGLHQLAQLWVGEVEIAGSEELSASRRHYLFLEALFGAICPDGLRLAQIDDLIAGGMISDDGNGHLSLAPPPNSALSQLLAKSSGSTSDEDGNDGDVVAAKTRRSRDRKGRGRRPSSPKPGASTRAPSPGSKATGKGKAGGKGMGAGRGKKANASALKTRSNRTPTPATARRSRTPLFTPPSYPNERAERAASASPRRPASNPNWISVESPRRLPPRPHASVATGRGGGQLANPLLCAQPATGRFSVIDMVVPDGTSDGSPTRARSARTGPSRARKKGPPRTQVFHSAGPFSRLGFQTGRCNSVKAKIQLRESTPRSYAARPPADAAGQPRPHTATTDRPRAAVVDSAAANEVQRTRRPSTAPASGARRRSITGSEASKNTPAVEPRRRAVHRCRPSTAASSRLLRFDGLSRAHPDGSFATPAGMTLRVARSAPTSREHRRIDDPDGLLAALASSIAQT